VSLPPNGGDNKGDKMRRNFGSKPILYPMPVLIVATFNADGTANAMNAAWGGISEENEISICIDSGHKTAENLVTSKAFTVSVATVSTLASADFVGIASGNSTPDKIARAGWSVSKSDFVNAPVFDELPLTLECRVKSYDTDSCRLVGEIVNVSADESVLTDGKIDADKLEAITYDPVSHTYRRIGEVVGRAFSDGKKLK